MSAALTSCPGCGESFEPDADGKQCECCPSCGGEGYLSDGGCDGGCEFCRPFPKCYECKGTGKLAKDTSR